MPATATRLAPMGIMNQMWAANDVSDRDAIRTALDEIICADELGFDSIWIGEHHHVRPDNPFYGRVPASEVFLAHIAAKTKRIKVGTGVRVLSTTTAQRTAEEMSLLHILAEGRVEFGVGLGANQLVEEDRATKAARFRALLDELLGILAGEIGPAIAPRPDPAIRGAIWAAARDESSIDHLALRGINLVVGQAEMPHVQAPYIARYRAAGGTGRTRGVRLVFVAPTRAEALERSAAAAESYFRLMLGKGYHKHAVETGMAPATIQSDEERRRLASFIIGSPEDVAAELNAYIETTGIDQLDIMAQIPGLATEDVRRSMSLVQTEVRPLISLNDVTAARSVA
ncbi:LLM class flavin-dependent oxidoreductase [Kaistia dalseonensis]|uniref:Alkanesulfonate monooxygenase SsuD/methylene tetrahydromethanopterin reductase-like flavin-dependent oxidoreductase (Luciferase family) n=1 Tax=Kaistia dalseonensis TaxID=410840 RepID=A0ABU0HDS0_9HYPH|nr:LLM class flavin-dependent oxidoreductase [Kaistia dalseonensis]MCX5497786.1 LLM class flavin-dependent oxidoreductase [Kaistia dalseonensis]MDQ0440430.1 alkanesulfonate monooxygenase SsuD/methylene tetrahydromethanopterin reductase-like flavin-dependent oxidoreductase (luciferase family) [Kaistia dalseonensis]